ncbi:MAG TPA: hypothetical protein V6D00_14040 [Pantanalinema sp.]
MLLTVGVLTLALATGCGKRLPDNMVEPEPAKSTEPTPAPTATPTPQPTPNPGNPSGGGGTTVQGNLILGTPVIKESGLMKRTILATVDVINPVAGTLSGEVTCYFGSGTDAEDIQTKTVSVMSGQKQTLTFEKTGWFASSKARCEIKTISSGGVSTNGYSQYY